MKIRQLIQDRLFNNDFAIFDSNNKRVNCEDFRNNYLKTKAYLKNHITSEGSVGIKLKKDHEYLMIMLACMDSGVPYVPVKDNYPDERIAQIKAESEFSELIDSKRLKQILSTDWGEYSEGELRPMDTLYTICTSGSTGRPKAVVVSRTSINDFWAWLDSYFPKIDKEDHILQVADFTFDISLIDVGLFLYKGATLHFSNFTGNIFTLAYEIEIKRISFLNTVVNNFNMLLEDSIFDRGDFGSLKSVVMGGGRFTYGLYEKCKKHLRKIDVNNFYGVTEVPVYSHAKRMNFDKSDLHDHTVSVGTTLGSTTCIVVKDNKELADGEKGELYLGGGQLMKGYANNPEKTAEVLVDFKGEIYYRTGDIGFKDESGQFFVTGRMDDTIKYRGFRINLTDIDSYVHSLEYIQDCVTVAVENEQTQNTTIAYVISKKEVEVNEFRKDLANILLDYQIPEKIFFVDSYPVNNNGKVCKKTLRSQYLQS